MCCSVDKACLPSIQSIDCYETNSAATVASSTGPAAAALPMWRWPQRWLRQLKVLVAVGKQLKFLDVPDTFWRTFNVFFDLFEVFERF